jgi:hypothetical protein
VAPLYLLHLAGYKDPSYCKIARLDKGLPFLSIHTKNRKLFKLLGIMSSQQVFLPAKLSTRALPTTDQWETHKEFLRRLYIVQEMRLKDVIATMQNQRNFYATAKMYKSRFSRWGFVKHNNLKDMETIACRIVQRGHTDINATFTVNGRSVTAQEVARYFRRRGMKSLKDAVERSMTTAQEANKGGTPGESLALLRYKVVSSCQAILTIDGRNREI